MYSFATKKKVVDLQSRIRRVLDLTVPNLSSSTDRCENRSNRAIPVLLVPWENEGPNQEFSTFAITKDVASDGIGLILHQPFRAEHVLVGFWLGAGVMEEPWFFLGTTQCLRPMGGGYWTLGVQLTECAELRHQAKLGSVQSLARQLQPAQAAAL